MTTQNILLIIAAAQALFAAGLLLAVDRTRSRITLLLCAFVALYGITLVRDISLLEPVYVAVPIFAPFIFILYLLLGPVLYFYTKALTEPPETPLVRHPWLHLLPIVTGFILFNGWLGLGPADREAALAGNLDAEDASTALLALGIMLAFLIGQIQMLVYLLASLGRLFRHQLTIRDLFSNLENKTLGWLRTLLLMMTALWIAHVTTEAADQAGQLGLTAEILFTIGELAILYVLAYFGVRQPAVFGIPPTPQPGDRPGSENIVPLHPPTESPSGGPSGPKAVAPAYAKSALDEDRMTSIADKLDNAMIVDRLYMRPTLTLADLSRHVSVQQSYVSQTLNQKLGHNFYDFVAMHRVEAAKLLLADPAVDQTVLDIALEVGFNSKSTFNAAFKRHAGLTPTAFRTQNRAVA